MSYYPDQPPSYLEATSNGIAFGGGGGGGSGFPGGGSGFPGGASGPSAPPPPPPPSSPPQDDVSVWFYAVDEDGNGHITANELQQALLGENFRPFSLTTCKMLVRMFDDNSNGEIELPEFVQLYHYVRKWREIFLRHDADLSGTIELEELGVSLNTVHRPLQFSRQFCKQMLRRFGLRKRDGEHCLDLDNFIALNARLSRLVNEYSGDPHAIESFLMSRMRDS